jgi:hypothetical protein
MLFIFSAKSNLQHWGKPSGSTPIFYEKISRLVVIRNKRKKAGVCGAS